MDRKRITMATGIRFWRATSGAEARIAQLLGHLSRSGFDVEVLFVGAGRDTPQQWGGVPIVEIGHYTAQIGALRRLAIRARAAARAATGALHGASRPKTAAGRDWRSTISDIEQAAFADYLRARGPGTVIVEYIWLTRLIAGLPSGLRRRLRCLVDTHDVMHLRTSEFSRRSREVYMAVDRDGERAALAHFDVIIAIQHSDAEALRALCPETPVVVAVHAGTVTPLPARREGGKVRFLFVGSKSHPNVDSLKGLLAEVWAPLHQRHGARVHLDIAGTIGARRAELPEVAGVSYLGIVDDLGAAYEQADVVLAPVLYGTGLKIKVVEALCFGKATVTMPAGVDGMIIDDAPPCAVLSEWPAYLETCERLIEEPAYAREFEDRAARFAHRSFSEEAAFVGLDRAIVNAPPPKVSP